ncbi:MAG: heme-dependent oxidative N-demethylase family protein [Rubrimonas sp.]
MSAPYAPFMEARTTHAPGLSPLTMADWLCCDPDYAAQMAERDRLLAEKRDLVAAALPEAVAALAELRAALRAAALARGDWRPARDGVIRPDGVLVVDALDDLSFIGRLVQEDFLLMAPPADGPTHGEYRLVGGVLCFPSRWLFSEKLGRAMSEIHYIVPGYAENLASRINRVFAALAVERPLTRVNWAVHPTDALHQPWSKTWNAPNRPLGQGLWLRTERQTLVRLGASGVVAFGIKLSVTPLQDLDPAQRTALRAALAGLSAEEVGYRGGPELHASAIAALAD